MIYITGDTHGDFRRFSAENFPEQKAMGKADYVIICGDFGGVWNNSKEERYWLDWLECKPFTTLFVSGNHENYDLLSHYPVQHWNGGIVQFIRPSVIHLMRGQVYEMVGKRFFTMGGASSHDITDGILDPNASDYRVQKKRLDTRHGQYRINHKTWWADELPDDTDYDEAERNLNRCGRQVDYMVSHCCPSSLVDILGQGQYQHDRLTDYFETLKDNCQFRYWFFGHYHDNRVLQQKYVLLYVDIMPLRPPR